VRPRAGGVPHRRLARGLLGYQVEAPPKFQPGIGILNRLDRRLRDRAAWRSVGYSLIKLPTSAVQLYAATLACIGLIDLSYPESWLLFHHHHAGQVSALVTLTPLPFGGT